MAQDPARHQPSETERIFAEWLVAREQAGPGAGDDGFEALCAEHSAHAAGLRDLRADSERVQALLEAARLSHTQQSRRAPGTHASMNPFELPPGTVIGDFRLVRQVGKPGGQGVVFEAQQLSLKRRVALKLLHSGALISERTVERFHLEAEAGARIHHPGLAVVYAFGEEGGRPYLAQEFIEGGDLREHLETLRRDEPPARYLERVASLFAELADALQAAHDAGVIHRDLKPGNILLTADGHPKVVDFGLATLREGVDPDDEGALMGTPLYMSPELVNGQRFGLDRRSDVFSLGSILYEALTGSPPFDAGELRGKAGLQAILEKISSLDPLPPERVADVPRKLSRITMRCLQKWRDHRYASMADLADDLRRFLDNKPLRSGSGSGSGSGPGSDGAGISEVRRGLKIAHYSLVERLGRGRQGEVWEAEDQQLGRHVALKLVEIDGSTQAQLDRFEQDAKYTALCAAPGIVRVIASGEAEGLLWIAMDLVPGGRTLAKVLQEESELADLTIVDAGAAPSPATAAPAATAAADPSRRASPAAGDDLSRRPPPVAADPSRRSPQARVRARATMFLQIAKALAHVHARGVVHRDLKPGNILIDAQGQPALCDFGMARLAAKPAGLTLAAERVGTPGYMSPEQITPVWGPVDARSDVFAFGICLYEALSLSHPFKADTPELSMQKVLTVDPTPLATQGSAIPADLAVITHKCLEKKREQRFASMAEVADELQRFLADEPIVTRPPGPVRRAQKWVRRHPTMSAVLAVALLSMGVFAWINAELQGALERETELTGTLETAVTDAEASAEQARRERANVLRLSLFRRLEDLTRLADELWPAIPELLPAYDAWLRQADDLVASLEPSADGSDPGLRGQLELLREHSPPAEATAAEREAFRNNQGIIDQMTGRRWWHDQLSQLIVAIEGLADPQTGLIAGISEAHGRGIAWRRDLAHKIGPAFVGPEADRRWAAAIASIADREQCPDYDGLQLSRQHGLLPIGRDPVSGLWEFWHGPSGHEALRGEDGKLALTETTGIVLVLIPGGTFWMGAQNDDPAGRNYDPQDSDGGPVQEVTLSPYFLSKYEMTRGQWARIAGRDPSSMDDTPLHPVTDLSWYDARRVLQRLGLDLPSEAQWERGCRGGTETVWWTGDDEASLAGKANVPLGEAGSGGPVSVVDLAANPFGLYHVHGNVWEWCLDAMGSYDATPENEPVPDDQGAALRVVRGGSFDYSAGRARSAPRGIHAPGTRYFNLGVRPAQSITP